MVVFASPLLTVVLVRPHACLVFFVFVFSLFGYSPLIYLLLFVFNSPYPMKTRKQVQVMRADEIRCCAGDLGERRLAPPPAPSSLSLSPDRSISSYYPDYICSLPKDNGMHRCLNLPPTKYEGGCPAV